MAEIEVEIALRERNQLTIPDRIVQRLGVEPGDRFIAAYDGADPDVIRLRRLLRSYAGIAGRIYGGTSEEQLAYVREERASWEDPMPAPGEARDGSRFLTFEESKRVHWQTEVTPERYRTEPKLRWPKCEICSRSIANMNEHYADHRGGRIDARGLRTDPEQQERSRRRVAKWRRSIRRKIPARSGE